MGVREVWTRRPKDGAAIYRRAADGSPSSVPESAVVPGVTRDYLDELWADGPWSETPRHRSAIVLRIRRRRGAGGAAPARKS